MIRLSAFRPPEPNRLDAATIHLLRARLGDRGIERLYAREVRDAVHRASEIRRAAAAGSVLAAAGLADALTTQVTGLGLTTHAAAAQAVADCLRQGDPTALSATLDRLDRIGARSRTALAAGCDLSG